MIHWLWLIPAAILGGLVGLIVTALCVIAKESDGND